MKRRNIERNIIKTLESRADKILTEFSSQPFIDRRERRRIIANKMRLTKPMANDILRLLETRNSYKKKRRINYF